MNLFPYDDIKISCEIAKPLLITAFTALTAYKPKKLRIATKEYMVACLIKDPLYILLSHQL